MSFQNLLLAVAMGAALSGCGGGGSGSTPAPAPVAVPPPQSVAVAVGTAGVYDIDYNGFTGIYTMLDNGDFYGIHRISNGSVLAGHPHGALTAKNSADSQESIGWANFIDASNGLGFQEPSGSFGRTFTSSILTVAITGSMGSFRASQVKQKTWSATDARTLYFDAIPLATIAGTYQGILRTVGSGRPKTAVTGFTIDATGAFSVNVIGCAFTGTMVKHGATGIFDLQAQSGGGRLHLHYRTERHCHADFDRP